MNETLNYPSRAVSIRAVGIRQIVRGDLLLLLSLVYAITGCGTQVSAASSVHTLGLDFATQSVAPKVTNRQDFVGAFFRPEGSPPFGIFSSKSSQIAPDPYPSPGGNLLGDSGYCDGKAANGSSIDSAYVVDSDKLNHLVSLRARWTRMNAWQFAIDLSHVFGTGNYAFSVLDAAQCATLAKHSIIPVIGLEAGPVQYNSEKGVFSPKTYPTYKTAADFGKWCGVVAAHEKRAFPTITKFSLPGNEVNSDPGLFPGGEPQIAAYSRACYAAIKAANPSAIVYGFELNMDGSLNAPAFVRRMVAVGCKPGTCYDAIAMHLSLRYPIPPLTTPCYPSPGGDYSVQCIADVEAAAQAPIHVLISESVYTVPGSVPDEQTKATAVVAAYTTLAANRSVDGVAYANIDECALYPTGFFSGGCLISTTETKLPAYNALAELAANHFH